MAYDENSFSKFVRYHNLYKRLGWDETMSILKIFIGCSNQAKVDKVIGKSKKKTFSFLQTSVMMCLLYIVVSHGL